MQRTAIIGLLQIDLPGITVRLCDGGFIQWNAATFMSSDPVFGTLGSVEALSEGIGDEIPALELTLLPPVSSAPADLSKPGYQNSSVWFWIGEYDPAAGTLIGDPDLVFFGRIDQTTLTGGFSTREVAITVVSAAERLFLQNDGNSLTPRWHKSVWPGERGHDNAVGLTIPVAWGVEQRPVAASGLSAPSTRSGPGWRGSPV